MITLYHSGASVCSQKVRLAMAEKGLSWESRDLDMTKGQHQTPAYLELNPNGVVPTLVAEDGSVIRESSVIIEYLDALAEPRLMPHHGSALWQTRLWLIRCIEIHAAINSLTFATVIREQVLNSMSPEQVEDWLSASMTGEIREKRRDLMQTGAASHFVEGAVSVMDSTFKDMSAALANSQWLVAETYSLADCALLAYADRVRRLGLAGLYKGRFDGIADWIDRSRKRPSYEVAVQAYYTAAVEESYQAAGRKAWPVIATKLQ